MSGREVNLLIFFFSDLIPGFRLPPFKQFKELCWFLPMKLHQWAFINLREKSQPFETWGKALEQWEVCAVLIGSATRNLAFCWCPRAEHPLSKSLSRHWPSMMWDIYDGILRSKSCKERFVGHSKWFWLMCQSLAKMKPNRTLGVYPPTVKVAQEPISNQVSTWKSL